MSLLGKQRERLTKALVQAFPDEGELERLVSFGLNENLYAISGNRSLTDQVFRLVRWAEAKGKLNELLIAVIDQCPNNTELQSIVSELQIALVDFPQNDANLEEIVYKTVNFVHVEHFLERFKNFTHTICRIEIPVGVPRGTGFLLGPSLVITNCHVLLPALVDRSMQEKVVLRFDYKTEESSKKLNNGVEYSLALRDNWVLAESAVKDLDYIIFRIEEKEERAIQLQIHQRDLGERLWLTPGRHIFTRGEPLLIMQHPQGIPLQLATGYVLATKPDLTRVYYTTNTLNGSSGAPCFTSDGLLVAIHCRGEHVQKCNEGVSSKSIVEDLQHKGLSGLLGEHRL